MVATVAVLKDVDYYDKEEVKQEKTKMGRIDKENYYSENGDSLGFYYGDGTKILNCHLETIQIGDLRKLTNGIEPKTNKILFKKRKVTEYKDESKKKKEPPKEGWDICFSAPKDFTILAEFDQGNRGIYEEIFNQAHIRALDTMNKKLYRRINSKNDKAFDIKPIQLCYDHKTARPLKDHRPDPQWHRHTITLKKCFDTEGKIRSIESFPIFQNQKLYGALFRAELANGLRNKFNYQIIPAKEDEISEDGLKGVKVNSFKVVGITDEMRNKFSGRSTEICEVAEKLAESKGTTASSVMKQFISSNIKRNKEVWNKQDLYNVWLSDANKVGLTKDYIESLKSKPVDPNNIGIVKAWIMKITKPVIDNMKLEETIIKQSLTKCKDGTYKLFESKLILRLVENEQVTGINAMERFQKLQDSGIITRTNGFEFSHKLKLDKELLITKSWKRNIKHDSKNSMIKVYSYKSQYNTIQKQDSNIMNYLSLMFPNLSQYKSFGEVAFLSMALLDAFKSKNNNNKLIIENKPQNKNKPLDKDQTLNLSVVKQKMSIVGTIERLGNSIADIQTQLKRHDLTTDERHKLIKKLDELFAEQENERLRLINSGKDYTNKKLPKLK